MTVFEEHTNIYEAIRDGDVSKAQNTMGKHMSSFAAKASSAAGRPRVRTIRKVRWKY